MKEEITTIIRTFEAVGPILGHALKSGQLFRPQCELTEPDPDILCEYDVNIPMSEGFSVTATRTISVFGKGVAIEGNDVKILCLVRRMARFARTRKKFMQGANSEGA